MIRIPTITLWNPWASWVKRGLKTVETREHNKYAYLTGKWIAIHAGKKWHTEAFEIARPYLTEDQLWNSQQLREECGHILCLAHVQGAGGPLLARHSQMALCDCSRGNLYGLHFDRIEPLADPVPISGGQGVWWWTPASERNIRDITSVCGMYEPGDPAGDCQSDGHYMCKERTHYQVDEE